MQKHTLIAAALTALAFAASPVLAGDGQKRKDGHKHDSTHTHANAQGKSKAPSASGRHDNGRHLGWYKQQWKRGDRVVLTNIEPRYYVTDYRAYRLTAPPQGYRWVRPMDDRYLLVNAATGVILKALGY